jgi:DNA-binding MarR family transcriptional regulator
MGSTNWLNPREARAWRGYMRMRDLLDLQIGRDLGREAGLSDADFPVLVTLSETEGHRIRLIELAQRLLWSKSRLAHHLDRMVRRDLVRREAHPRNSRATIVALTAHGLHTLQAAAPAHVASVRRNFIDLLTDAQIDALGDATETVVEHLAALVHPAPARRQQDTPARRTSRGSG